MLGEEQHAMLWLIEIVRPDRVEVFLDPGAGALPDRHHAVFLALAQADKDRALAQVHVIDAEAH